MHRTNATVTGVAAVVMTLIAVLVWRPGRGPWWPAPVSAGLFGVEALQIVLGYARTLAVHVPLGVAIITALVLLSVRDRRPGVRRHRRHALPRDGPDPAHRWGRPGHLTVFHTPRSVG